MLELFNLVWGDIVDAVSVVLRGSSRETLFFMVIAAIVSGLWCSKLGHLPGHAWTALVMVGLFLAVYSIFIPGAPETASGWSRVLSAKWSAFMSLNARTLLGHYLVLVAMISVVLLVRRFLPKH